MMRLAVFLAFAVFAGSQASFLSDEMPRLHLDRFCDTIREYLDRISKTTADSMESICHSKLSKEINTCITNSFNSAQSYQMELQLPLAIQHLLQGVVIELQGLKKKMQPYADDLNQKVQGSVTTLHEHLAPVAGELLEQVEQQMQVLQQAVVSGTKELKQKLAALQTQLGPLVEDLNLSIERSVQDFQQGMESLTQQLQGRLSQGVQQAHHNLYPYAEDLHQKVVPVAKKLQKYVRNV